MFEYQIYKISHNRLDKYAFRIFDVCIVYISEFSLLYSGPAGYNLRRPGGKNETPRRNRQDRIFHRKSL